MFNKLKLLFTYGPELEQVLENIRKEKEADLWEKTRYNLNLCLKHKQESNRSNFSSDNCDYCRLEKELEMLKRTKTG